MRAFSYERPTTIADAARLLSRDGARALAGGTDLIPQLREGRRAAHVIVDLKHIPELRAIRREADGGWRIGAAASVSQLAKMPELAREHGALIASAQVIGSLQVQSRASLGGNLINGAPSADGVPLLHALGAMAVVADEGSERSVGLDAIQIGPGQSALKPGELLVALLLPPKPARSGACYLRFTPRREMDIAIAGSGVAVELGSDGVIASARITLASVGPVPIRAANAEALLRGEKAGDALIAEAGRVASSEAKPISDTRGSADYRRHLIKVLTERALTRALEDAGRQRESAA
ncbi:MAG: xanthine dehydrogenase family protein subunit M [Proteobacteria bacterium]|nr:xanthine dehydrogenase family protein subunit M [Pseudomonadota bacterium]